MKVFVKNTSMWMAMILVAALFAGGCTKESETTGKALPQPEVAVVRVEAKPIATTTELAGRTSAYLVAEVRPQVGGIIQKRLFTEGSDVKAGQVLYQIDPAIYQSTLNSAKAVLARSMAQHSTIKLKEERLRGLLADKAVSQQDYDDVAAALKQTEADIQAGKASVEAAEINLRYTSVKAPISGRIGRSNVTEGALVTAQQPAALATIQQLDPIYVDVTQSTADILRLRQLMQKGQLDQNGKKQKQVRLLMDDGTEYPLRGVLQFRDISVDPTTGSVVLRILFPNPKMTLMPGMFVKSFVQEGIYRNAILVPQQAVSRNPKGEPLALIVDKEGKVEQRALVLDRVIGDAWLVSSGLSEGDQVIVEGMQKVRAGISVKVVSDGAAGGQSKAAASPGNAN